MQSGKHVRIRTHKGEMGGFTLCFSFFCYLISVFLLFFRDFLPPQTCTFCFSSRIVYKRCIALAVAQHKHRHANSSTQHIHSLLVHHLNDNNKTNNRRNKKKKRLRGEKTEKNCTHFHIQTAEFSAEQLRERRSNIPYYITMLCIYIICIICI
jgi:hypothetical protein